MMNSEYHVVSICDKVCVTSLSVVARNRRMLLYKLNGDGQMQGICHQRIVFNERWFSIYSVRQ